MKRLSFLLLGLMLVGCGQKAPLSEQEQWHGYCTSMGNAARSIMLDRQNGIDQAQATEHANKIEESFTRNFILNIISEVYQIPDQQMRQNPDQVRETLRSETTERCLATEHEGVPAFKPF